MKTCLYRCLQPAKSEVCWQGAATRWSPPPSGAQCRREGSQASQNISLSQHVQPGSQSCLALREWHTCQRCKIEFIHAGLAPNCKCLGSVLHRARVAGMVQGPFLPRPAGTRRDEDFEQLSLFERGKNLCWTNSCSTPQNGPRSGINLLRTNSPVFWTSCCQPGLKLGCSDVTHPQAPCPMVRYCIAEKTTGKMKGTKALPKDAVAAVGEKIREQGGGVKDTTKI